MSLTTLPPELLSYIATHFLPSLQDVSSLAKASKHLYTITNPILYHHQIYHEDSSALLWAATHGKPDPCTRLLQEGANPNTQDPQNRRTPLSWAAGNGFTDVVSVLLCAGAPKIDTNAPDARGQTPLFWAAGRGLHLAPKMWNPHSAMPTNADVVQEKAKAGGEYLAIVKLFLSNKTIQPDCRTQRGETPLAVAAASGADDVVEALLLTGKVDANSKDNFGQTPLHAAARNGHMGIVKRLLGIEGVDTDARSTSGESPLLGAAGNGHTGIVELLLAIPTVDPDQQPSFGDRALLTAVAAGHTDVVEVLLANERVDPSAPNKQGVTALVRAAQRGRTHIMRLLLAKGVDPEEKDREGSTPLMIAAERGDAEAVELLLLTGRVQADFDLTKRNRNSSAFRAPSKLNEDVVRMLDGYKSRHRGDS
ncbi:putative ankyrin repeat protein [Aspergillus affinis]|uniref:putative ankyrin repeat protein n=1 Tax=Aspergillus affinis TaxID=1070780 RepID=UPI0022FDF1BF|nr:putative ankyrin repeat protein [Aspergillus affinis]KAI9039614.1 putative ankyrin repeat protein [Aspergillus affinis]